MRQKWIVVLLPLALVVIGFIGFFHVLPWVYIGFLDAEVEGYAVLFNFCAYVGPMLVVVGVGGAVALRRACAGGVANRLVCWVAVAGLLAVLGFLVLLFPAEVGGARAGASAAP
jgi:hypothetical protein